MGDIVVKGKDRSSDIQWRIDSIRHEIAECVCALWCRGADTVVLGEVGGVEVFLLGI